MNANTQFIYTPRSFKSFLERFNRKSHLFNSMGGQTREIINASLLLRNPRDRIVINDIRRANVAFGICEWIQIMMCDDSLETVMKYNKSIKKYSEDGKKIEGSYGSANGHTQPTQIQKCIQRLFRDKNTRRAVFAIYRPQDTEREGLNTPCTISLQFLIRDDKLHMIVNMRSNDLIWGLTYDAFVFTMIQEYVCASLQRLGLHIELGQYFHNAASLHLYERHFNLEKELDPRTWNLTMAPMPEDFTSSKYELAHLMECVRNVDNDEEFYAYFHHLKTEYGRNLALTCKAWYDRNDYEKAQESYKQINDMTLCRSLRSWF